MARLKVVDWLVSVAGHVLFLALCCLLVTGGAYLPLWLPLPVWLQVPLAVVLPFAGLWLALRLGAMLTGNRRL